MYTAKEICNGLNFPRVSQATPVIVKIKNEEFPACMYLDLFDDTWTLYIPTKLQIGGGNDLIFFTVASRFVDQIDTTWYLTAYKVDSIESFHKMYHPFGQSVILKQISSEMADAIELSKKSRKMVIENV